MNSLHHFTRFIFEIQRYAVCKQSISEKAGKFTLPDGGFCLTAEVPRTVFLALEQSGYRSPHDVFDRKTIAIAWTSPTAILFSGARSNCRGTFDTATAAGFSKPRA